LRKTTCNIRHPMSLRHPVLDVSSWRDISFLSPSRISWGGSNPDTGWRRLIGCLILIGHIQQKSPRISGSFAESDLQLKASYGSSPGCTICFPIWISQPSIKTSLLGGIKLTFEIVWHIHMCGYRCRCSATWLISTFICAAPAAAAVRHGSFTHSCVRLQLPLQCDMTHSHIHMCGSSCRCSATWLIHTFMCAAIAAAAVRHDSFTHSYMRLSLPLLPLCPQVKILKSQLCTNALYKIYSIQCRVHLNLEIVLNQPIFRCFVYESWVSYQ